MVFRCIVLALVVALCLEVAPVYSQTNTPINTPCTASMISSFTPCLNFLTNSSGNGGSPTAGCCSALKALTSRGTDCLCLIVTGGVPFQIPINRNLAISLPRACRMSGVPIQCKGSAGAPVPPPGTAVLGPAQSPESSSTDPETLSPNTTPGAIIPGLAPPTTPDSDTTPDTTPDSDTTPGSGTIPFLTPPSTGGTTSGFPTTGTGSRPNLSAASTYVKSPFVLTVSGVMFILYFLF